MPLVCPKYSPVFSPRLYTKNGRRGGDSRGLLVVLEPDAADDEGAFEVAGAEREALVETAIEVRARLLLPGLAPVCVMQLQVVVELVKDGFGCVCSGAAEKSPIPSTRYSTV